MTKSLAIIKKGLVEVHAQKEILSNMVQSLSEVKHSKTRAHLVTKHAILIAMVSLGIQGSI